MRAERSGVMRFPRVCCSARLLSVAGPHEHVMLPHKAGLEGTLQSAGFSGTAGGGVPFDPHCIRNSPVLNAANPNKNFVSSFPVILT